MMHIKKLHLLNFRSHTNFNIDNLGPFVQIIGPNGSGKTNILEAISLLSPGRGMHKSDYKDILSKTQQIYIDWSVKAELDKDSNICTGAVLNKGHTHKKVSYINGEKVKNQAELLHMLRIIWLTPQMDGIFIAPSANRRKFLDRLTYNFQPEHASNVAKYEYFMRSRLKLLMGHTYDKAWLTQLEEKMAYYAHAIFESRNHILKIINTILLNQKSSLLKPILSLEEDGNNIDIEGIRKTLYDNRNSDSNRGRSHFGPHKSDLIALHPTKCMKASQCSTGEQKAMLIGLMLAQAEGIKTHCNHNPVVLLDELFSHLDNDVKHHLLETLMEFNGQIWSTSTEYLVSTKNETIINLP